MNRKKVVLTLTSVLAVITAAMLAAAVIGIYRDGAALKAADPLNWIFTREKVLAALTPVLPLLAVTLAVTAAALFFGIRDEDKPVPDTGYLRDLTLLRTAQASEEMKAEEKLQKKLLLGGWAAFALCMVPVLLYITDGTHFPDGDLEPVFFSLIAHVVPWTAIGLAALMGSAHLREKSMQREITAAKEEIRREKEAGARPPEKGRAAKSPGGARLLRAVLLIAAVCMIAAGVLNGSARDVFGKAVKICTECIGLG